MAMMIVGRKRIASSWSHQTRSCSATLFLVVQTQPRRENAGSRCRPLISHIHLAPVRPEPRESLREAALAWPWCTDARRPHPQVSSRQAPVTELIGTSMAIHRSPNRGEHPPCGSYHSDYRLCTWEIAPCQFRLTDPGLAPATLVFGAWGMRMACD